VRIIEKSLVSDRVVIDTVITETAESTAPIKQKRKMSAAGRKAISDATKKRWAAVRAAKAQPSKKVVAKKKGTKATKKSAGASATAA
jgi:hypothetical protein